MKFNPKLKTDIGKYFDYVIIVEGKKDVAALKALGFEKVYPIHEAGVPIRERVYHLSQIINKKEKVCILTDFDKKGKKLYLLLKSLFQEQGVRLDSTLRGLLLQAGISHIEGLHAFFEKVKSI